MKKMIFLLCAFAMLAFTVINCNTGVSPDNGEGKLFNTKWKLVGFFDGEKNEFREVGAEDCDGCYTLEFGPDNMVTEFGEKYWQCLGKYYSIGFVGYYRVDHTRLTINFRALINLGIEQPSPTSYYASALYEARSFELSDSELKLFGINGNYIVLRRMI